MTPPTLISIINQSNRITDSEVQAIVSAVSIQLSRDVFPIWGQVPALEFVPQGSTPSEKYSPCFILDTPDVDGIFGYHDEDEEGISYIKVFTNPILDSGGSVTQGSNSVSVTVSHEVLEVLGDSPANIWADGPNGYDYAYELSDAVQSDFYDISGVSVSNFVYPAFFDPRAERNSKFDYLGKLSHPFEMTKGGYQIIRAEPGKITEIYAEIRPGVYVAFGEDVLPSKQAEIIAKYQYTGRRKARQ